MGRPIAANLPAMSADHGRVFAQREPAGHGDGLAGDVVGRRAEATADQHQGVPAEQAGELVRQLVFEVADDRLAPQLDAVGAQQRRHPQAVGVEPLGAEQLGPHRDPGGVHRPDHTGARRGVAPRAGRTGAFPGPLAASRGRLFDAPGVPC
jgi:hypothetical protein